ncbi:MAG: hypothetical protein WAL02_16780 [Rhodoplanes sp.]
MTVTEGFGMPKTPERESICSNSPVKKSILLLPNCYLYVLCLYSVIKIQIFLSVAVTLLTTLDYNLWQYGVSAFEGEDVHPG